MRLTAFSGGLPWLVLVFAAFELPEPAAGQENSAQLVGYEQTFPAMGTTVTFSAFVRDESMAAAAFKEARTEVERLVGVLSDYDDDSELSKLNQSAGSGTSFSVSPDLWQVLDAADRWHKLSHGAFDASVGSLTRLWRKSRRQKQLPSADEIETALQNSGWKNVRLDAIAHRVEIARQGVSIDLGAIAKGYVVDRAFEILKRHSIGRCMVNAGGDLRCGDAPPELVGWRVAIAPLTEKGPSMRVLSLSNTAIATSGDLWQYSLIDGVRRSHILDPKTGLGIEGPLSVSAIALSATDADAAATALSVLGHQRGGQLAEAEADLDAMFVSRFRNEPTIRYSATSNFSR